MKQTKPLILSITSCALLLLFCACSPHIVTDVSNYESNEKVVLGDKQKIPKNILKVSIGPSWLAGKVRTPKQTYDHPLGWAALMEYQHSLGYGFGVGINAAFSHAMYDDYVKGSRSPLSFFYLGPAVTWSTKLGDHWMIYLEEGIGYVRMDDSYDVSGRMGLNAKIGVDYMITKKWGVGIETNIFGFSMNRPTGYTSPAKMHYNFERINVLLGIRWYL